MSQTYGRHRGSSSDRVGNVAAAIIALAALGGVGVVAVQGRAGSGTGDGRGATAGVQGPTGSRQAEVRTCDDATTIYASPDLTDALARVADDYRVAQRSACARVAVQQAAGPAALPGLLSSDRAALWLARSEGDVAALPSSVRRTAPQLVASTPVVLAMPSAMADTSTWGWPTRPLTPDAWRSWMLGRSTWAQTGHPEWASFSIRMADPATSPTAAIGFGAMITLANGGPLAKAPDYAEPSDKDLAVIKVEHRITSLAGNDGDVLPDQDDTLSEVTSRASAYVTTERAVAAHNAGDPTVPLAAVPLAGGAASVPLSVLGVGATADDAPGAASARGFRAYLTSASGLAALRAAGLRAPDGAAPTDHPAGVAYAAAPLRPAAVPLPVLQQTVQAWRGMHSRISSMVLVDASGSMNQHLAGGATSRIDLVRGLVGNVYQTASPRARSGVWFFHTSNELGTPLIERATDLAVNEGADAGRQHSDVVVQAMSDVTIKGGTPLYQAVREAYAYTLDEYDPGYVNQLVVLSDGANRDTTSPDTLGQLLTYLNEAKDPQRPVRIICLGYGAEADMGALQAIASATGGRAAQVNSPSEMKAAVNLALFSL